MTTPDRPAGIGWPTWLGMAVVLAAAAVLSFSALRDLALAVHIWVYIAWLLPISVDAGAAVSCRIWLARRVPADAENFARGMTWALLGVTVAGNAAATGMTAENIVPPWWAAVAVGSVAPAVVGCVIHLMVLVGRTPAAQGAPDVTLAAEAAVTPSTASGATVTPPAVSEDFTPPVTHPAVSLTKESAPVAQQRDDESAPAGETPDERRKRLARLRAKKSRDNQKRTAQPEPEQGRTLRAVGRA